MLHMVRHTVGGKWTAGATLRLPGSLFAEAQEQHTGSQEWLKMTIIRHDFSSGNTAVQVLLCELMFWPPVPCLVTGCGYWA